MFVDKLRDEFALIKNEASEKYYLYVLDKKRFINDGKLKILYYWLHR